MEEKIILDQENEGSINKGLLLEIDKLLRESNFLQLSALLKKEVLSNNKLTEEGYLSQILLTICIFTFMKLQKYDVVSDSLKRFKFDEDNILFCLKFMEGKFYYMTNDYQKAIIIFNKLLQRYSNNDENLDLKNVEQNSEFLYFSQFFKNFLCLNSNTDKIKKCIFEIKNTLIKLGMNNEAYKIIEKYHEIYNDDIVFVFELLKQSIIISNFQKVEEMFFKIKNQFVNSSDSKKNIYENYMNFAEALTWISKGEYEIAKNKLTEILKNNPDNVIVINNLSTLNIYLNKVDKAYLDYKIILDKDQMNCFNEITFSNINTLTDVFNLAKYP